MDETNSSYPSAGTTNAGTAPQQSYQQQYQQQYQQGGYQAAPQAQPVYQQPSGQQQPQQPKHEAKKSGGGVKTFFLGFAGALVACALAFGVGGAFGLFGSASNEAPVVLPSGDGSSVVIDVENDDPTLAEVVAAKCLPSVAAIDVYATDMGSYYGFGFVSEGSGELVESSLGSGVVYSSDGYIITNYHVVEGGEAFKVTVGGQTYDAELVGSDPSSDVAVLKCANASGLTVMEIGDSDDLTIGEWVMSIGSPFGLEQSVATGIVSATSRSQIMDSSDYSTSGEITIYPNMIQTDAAINPGNSGGALVDSEGRLIGINTLITSYSGNYSGVGFAIPVNYAVSLADQIIAGEVPSHAQLGVTLSNVTPQIAEFYGLAVDEGAYISGVYAGSGAEAAGIEPGDIIVGFDGLAVTSASDLMLDVRTKNPGDVVVVTVNRGGEVLELEVTLGSDTDASGQIIQQESMPNGSNGQGQGGQGQGGSGQLDLFDLLDALRR